MATKPAKKLIRLIENHDYMSIRTPNGTFTMGYSGEKGSGALVKDGGFDAMTKFITDYRKEHPGCSNGDAMRALASEAVIAKIWPGWNAPPKAVDIGDLVRIPSFAKKFGGIYEVVEVKKNTADLILDVGRVNLQKHELVIVGKVSLARSSTVFQPGEIVRSPKPENGQPGFFEVIGHSPEGSVRMKNSKGVIVDALPASLEIVSPEAEDGGDGLISPSASDTLDVTNGCLKVNGKPFVVDVPDAILRDTDKNQLVTEPVNGKTRWAAHEIKGYWA